MKFSIFIQNLKNKLFGKDQRQKEAPISEPTEKVKEILPRPSGSSSFIAPVRQPYFIQIGFDFGTSYSKCICRDVVTDKAWVHIPHKCVGQEFPFLNPSTLLLRDGTLSAVENLGCHYPENGLYHLKHALVKVSLRQFDDPVLNPYKTAAESQEVEALSGLIENCAIYYLAGALGEVRAQIRHRLPGFGALPNDYAAVNLAIPVADAERPVVNTVYQRILGEAWGLADNLCNHPKMHLNELQRLRKEKQSDQIHSLNESCFIYPEVSANVQGFVRSRVSSPGIYLFSDAGASTVDQSVFIFIRQDEGEYLTYLHGSVLPLGSGQIEHIAAMASGNVEWQSLEKWREIKEQGRAVPELRKAKEWIAGRLSQGTEATLAFAKKKLYLTDQLRDIRVIFGGGGHYEYPYKAAVMIPFSGQLFHHPIVPDVVGLPIPRDLQLGDSETRWMPRLSVAYGLSFEKGQLTGFTYPKDVSTPDAEELWPRFKNIPEAPSKDQC